MNDNTLSGGSNDYYKVRIRNPTTGGASYTAECNDLIEALDLNYAEGNVFKAIWRIAQARKERGKPGNTRKYDAEKAVFFAERILVQNKD